MINESDSRSSKRVICLIYLWMNERKIINQIFFDQYENEEGKDKNLSVKIY